MPCYHPITGYRSRVVNPSGKRSIVFNPRDGYTDLPVTVPCGQCIGCRLERSRQWAIRCVHEASLHDENCFVTLTFDDAHLDPEGSLRKEDFQKFMKRLRRKRGAVRYFHCGEYGDLNNRPHHHACLFGINFPDREMWSTNNGVPMFVSEELSELWPFGYATIGEVTFESAAYVARYIMKKQTGKEAQAYYGSRIPPYNTMSRRPGIGSDWIDRYQGDVYPGDFVVIRNDVICKPPKFYDTRLDLTDPLQFRAIKRGRVEDASRRAADNTLDRLAAREDCKIKQLTQLKRII